ncbi:lycopene cyclase domain-containing protein [Paramicrobacterium sp. CJ85]|uniref:lycopene cyclase domain-containing protein n=1 Tax=Paramicrobacterium sp. CJ85 TaxID=3445355 RepID=UPI003F5EBD89
MQHAQYLILMAGCVLITLPLELLIGVRVYRSPRKLFLTLAPTFVIFALWDLLGIAREHWDYNGAFISGIHLGVIPLEELVFFAVIPLCGLLTYEAVGKVLRLAQGRGPLRFRWPEGLVRGEGAEEHEGSSGRKRMLDRGDRRA